MWHHNGYTDLHRRIVLGLAPRVTVRLIAEEVAGSAGVRLHDLLGRVRARAIARARQEVMRRALDAGFSSCHVGRVLGRDHTTVLHGAQAARLRLARLARGDM